MRACFAMCIVLITTWRGNSPFRQRSRRIEDVGSIDLRERRQHVKTRAGWAGDLPFQVRDSPALFATRGHENTVHAEGARDY